MLNHFVRSMALLALTITATSAHAKSQLTWKTVLATGDDSIPAFDNARKKIKSILETRGVDSKNIRELSVSEDEAQGDVMKTTLDNIYESLGKLSVRGGDACLVHLTSHGSPRGFFYIAPKSGLTPVALNEMLEETCGDRPTVVLVSACYSGVFTGEVMQKPNRIVLTAARADRPSFGCHPDETYTYWDTCLIETLPTAKTWKDVHNSVVACVKGKEDKLIADGKPIKPSFPQAFAGSEVKGLEVP